MYIEKIGSVVKDIGSVMITGLQISDSKKCFFGLVRELIQKGEPIWLFDGTLHRNEQKKLIEYAISQGYRIYFFGEENMLSQTIDIMSISDNLTKKAESLSDAVCDYKTDIKREVAVRFFKNAVTAKMSGGEAFRAADVIGQNLEQIKFSIKETDLLSEDKKQEETIFLSSSEVKNLAYYLNKRKERLHDMHFLDFISGNKNISEIENSKSMLFFSYYSASSEQKKDYGTLSEKFMDICGMLIDDMNYYERKYHIFISDVKNIQSERIRALAEKTSECTSNMFPMCILSRSDDDVCVKLDEISSAFDTIMIFKVSQKESLLWSSFFPLVKKNNISYNYSRKKSPFGNFYPPGGVVERNDRKMSGMNVSKEEKPLYRPDFFTKNMAANACLIYDRRDDKKKKLIFN